MFLELRSGCFGVCHMAGFVERLSFGRSWVDLWW